MPVITVESWPMKPEQKPEVIEKITNIFTDMGIPAHGVTVILHESPLENWGTSGEQHSVKFKDLKRD